MRMRFTKRMLAMAISALVLSLGPVPEDLTWDEGYVGISQAFAARGESGHSGGGPPAGAGGGHDGGSHDSDSHEHDSDSRDHDTDSHDHEDGGHESGGDKGKGKGPAYQGGRTGTSKGRGGPSHSVIEKIFENE